MSERFSLTKHCHQFLKERLYSRGVLIDMTVGKGNDLLFLASLVPDRLDHLMAIDVQKQAIEASYQKLSQSFCGKEVDSIEWKLGSHEHIHKWLLDWPLANQGVSLALYNLGYLPGFDKSITTKKDSTLKSLEDLMPWILPGGGISLMVYPGHEEGKEESKDIDQFLENSIDTKQWHLWQMKKIGAGHAPYWIWMQKAV